MIQLFQGERFLDGLQPKDYKVQIGAALCANIDVFSNLIVCDPPPKRPDVDTADYIGTNRIPVKVDYNVSIPLSSC